MTNGTIQYLQHESQVLKANPLGDPSSRKLPVYLPPGYDERPRERYPVIWVLAPFASWGERFFNLQAWDDNIVQRADRLIDEGKVQPAILVFPDCFTRFGGSQYLNSSAVGNYEDYLTTELVQFVDQKLRTRPEREHRAVMGHSSGGYGALLLGMRHPEIFSAVACHSADMMFEQCYWPDIPGAVRQWASVGGVEKFIERFPDIHDKGKEWGNALSMVAMSACYSPNSQSALGFDLLCDPHTGEIREEVWKRWQAMDPTRIATQHLDGLKRLKLLYFDCGARDEYNLFLGARALHRILVEGNVPHQYQEFDGGHQRINWRYEVSLPLLSVALSG